MALTLAEASKLSNDMLKQGVIETIIKESPVLQRLPFIEIAGNGLTYNQEKTLPSIDFYDVGEDWAESTLPLSRRPPTSRLWVATQTWTIFSSPPAAISRTLRRRWWN